MSVALPSVEDSPADTTPKTSRNGRLGKCEFTVPLAPASDSVFKAGHLNIQLKREQKESLNRLFRALDQRGDRLRNGRRVQTPSDAVRWLLEQIEV